MGNLESMKLEAWLKETRRSPAQFARELGVEPSTVHRLIRGERKPSHEIMEKIAAGTAGAVRPDDFFDGLPASPSEPNKAEAA